jgi:hypothetical protein
MARQATVYALFASRCHHQGYYPMFETTSTMKVAKRSFETGQGMEQERMLLPLPR